LAFPLDKFCHPRGGSPGIEEFKPQPIMAEAQKRIAV
jgi:hypothetical protein